MPRLNQLFNRAQLSSEEIHILRGVAKAMSQAAAQARLPAPAAQAQASPAPAASLTLPSAS
jgi:tRNA/rRNA methyltransferase